MREIRFRAWDKESKLMFSAEEMSKDQLTLDVNNRGLANLHPNRRLSMFDEHKKYILMQYTGLNDNTKWEELTEKERAEWVQIEGNFPSEWKGKEIYEGNKIRVTDDGEAVEGESGTGIGIIMFAFGMWYVSGIENSLYDINDCYEIKIIGNDSHLLDSEEGIST